MSEAQFVIYAEEDNLPIKIVQIHEGTEVGAISMSPRLFLGLAAAILHQSQHLRERGRLSAEDFERILGIPGGQKP